MTQSQETQPLPDWHRPALDPCECPTGVDAPLNESEMCDPCIDDFNWAYCEPDGWKDNAERIEAGEQPVYPDTSPDRDRAALEERWDEWQEEHAEQGEARGM